MLLGGSLPAEYAGAEEWAAEIERIGYAATCCPLPRHADESEIAAVEEAAKRHHIRIAEVGVWRNTLSPDAKTRRDAIAYAKEQLALAERLQANCCVNISGARGETWDGGYAENYEESTYALVIDTVREIIDAVKPRRTYYTLEPMPWMAPDSPEQYLRLIKDIERPAFAVHLDFVNMINCPRRFLNSNAFIEDCFTRLAPYVRSVHIKDATMAGSLPTVIRECAPGLGALDYRHIVRVIDRTLPKDTPVILEHMNTREEYARAYGYVAAIANEEGILIR